MKANDLEALGYKEVDENEYSNGMITIFILDDDKISLIGENDDDFLSIPVLNCKTKEDLMSFLKLVNYDIQNKN